MDFLNESPEKGAFVNKKVSEFLCAVQKVHELDEQFLQKLTNGEIDNHLAAQLFEAREKARKLYKYTDLG